MAEANYILNRAWAWKLKKQRQ